MSDTVTIIPQRNTGHPTADYLSQQLTHWRQQRAAAQRSAAQWQGVLDTPSHSADRREHVNAANQLALCETRLESAQQQIDSLTANLADLGFVLA